MSPDSFSTTTTTKRKRQSGNVRLSLLIQFPNFSSINVCIVLFPCNSKLNFIYIRDPSKLRTLDPFLCGGTYQLVPSEAVCNHQIS